MPGEPVEVVCGDCVEWLRANREKRIHLTFLDPPFRQGKNYRYFNDNMPEWEYWKWIEEILSLIHDITVEGGAIYFMHREKNTEFVLKTLRESGWNFKNLIIWKKKTSAVPYPYFSKQYQIIAFAVKGERARVFNKLRVDAPPPPEYKYTRKNGIFVTDVWDDIRELTSGYFAGEEALRDAKGNRIHTQQTPIALLLRIILASSLPNDTILDPFAGTGTTLVVAKQLKRNAIGIEIDPEYVELIKWRLLNLRAADNIMRYYDYYRFTENLEKIWPVERRFSQKTLEENV